VDDDEKPKLALRELPIEWVEDRVCEETFENRRLLRENGHRWRPVPPDPDSGMPSGLIEVPDPVAEQESALVRHAPVLVDPRDPWSDFVDVRELPVDATGVPYWIHRKAEQWHEWNASEGKPVEPGTAGRGVVAKRNAGKEPHLPTRCTAVKKDGTRCWAWAVDKANDGKCRAHAPGAALQANMGHQIALAKVKVMQAMPAMADALEELALTAASEQVRLKAVTEMMDRGGVNAQTDINVTGGIQLEKDPAAEIRERLAGLASRLAPAAPSPEAGHAADSPDDGDVVDAEIVEEESA
jgi:hypothetical protein